jgi:hypothetical protein
MVRTQIYLPTNMYQQLVAWGEQINQPMAEIIRRLISDGLKKKPVKAGNNLLELTKINGRGGPKDLAAKMDEYLYGKGSN